ncbi:CPBP family intramembrane glutamic endopeptidase [Fredinandcohnia humi]
MKNPYIRVTVLFIIQTIILISLFVTGMNKFIQSSNTYIFAVASILGSIAAILATCLFYKLVDKKSLRTIHLSLNRKQVLFCITFVVVIVSLFFGVTMILSKMGIVTAQFQQNYFSNIHVIPIFILSAISWFLVALNEELQYRGYMVANLKHLKLPSLFIISSLFFVASHILKVGLNPLLLVLLSGAITLMYIYLKTESLMCAIIPHFIYDFLTEQLIGSSEISIIQIEGIPSNLYSAILWGLFLLTQIVMVNLFFKEKVTIRWKKRHEGVFYM